MRVSFTQFLQCSSILEMSRAQKITPWLSRFIYQSPGKKNLPSSPINCLQPLCNCFVPNLIFLPVTPLALFLLFYLESRSLHYSRKDGRPSAKQRARSGRRNDNKVMCTGAKGFNAFLQMEVRKSEIKKVTMGGENLTGNVVFQVWCRLLHVVLYYFLISNYSWMLCEGVYLHTVLVSAFIMESRLLKYMLILGWGVPGLTIAVYASVRHFAGDAEETSM